MLQIFKEFKNLNLFYKIKNLKINIFISYKPPCGHVMSHKKIGPYRFSRFDAYWIQTNKQTDEPNLYIDIYRIELKKLDYRCF